MLGLVQKLLGGVPKLLGGVQEVQGERGRESVGGARKGVESRGAGEGGGSKLLEGLQEVLVRR